MKTMVLWSVLGATAGFVFLFLAFRIATEPHHGEQGLWIVFSIMGAIPAAAIGAIFAAAKTVQLELREARRELKHWQSIQQLDVDLDKPLTKFKATAPPRIN